MSTRYSNSPTLDIAPAESIVGATLFFLLALAVTLALMLLALKGYALLVAALVLPALSALASLWLGRSAGCRLRWHSGQWLYCRRGSDAMQSVSIEGLLLPFLTQLSINDGSRRWSCLLFHDSLEDKELRGLRRLLRYSGELGGVNTVSAASGSRSG